MGIVPTGGEPTREQATPAAHVEQHTRLCAAQVFRSNVELFVNPGESCKFMHGKSVKLIKMIIDLVKLGTPAQISDGVVGRGSVLPAQEKLCRQPRSYTLEITSLWKSLVPERCGSLYVPLAPPASRVRL